MVYSDILRSVKTTEHARDLLSEIDILLDAIFKTEANAFEKALHSIGILTSQALKFVFPGGFEDKTMIKEYLIGLRDQLQKLKVLKLSLVFEPSENSIDNLFAWVLKNLGVGIVLDIKKDKTILGGAIIEFEGKYKDLSLRKRVEEVFRDKREEILTHLSS